MPRHCTMRHYTCKVLLPIALLPTRCQRCPWVMEVAPTVTDKWPDAASLFSPVANARLRLHLPDRIKQATGLQPARRSSKFAV